MPAASPALAAGSPLYQFHIAPKPTGEALIDFAVQSNLSVGGIADCGGESRGLNGRFTAEDGLRLLLAGSDCSFRRMASDTIRIQPARPAAAAAIAEPAALPAESWPMPVVQEVVVNATKRAANLDQLPYAVSALNADDMRTAGAVDVDEIASKLASFSTTNLGPGRDKILLRGLSDGVFTGRTQSTVGVYLDDVPVTYNAPDPDLHIGDLDKSGNRTLTFELNGRPRESVVRDGSIQVAVIFLPAPALSLSKMTEKDERAAA